MDNNYPRPKRSIDGILTGKNPGPPKPKQPERPTTASWPTPQKAPAPEPPPTPFWRKASTILGQTVLFIFLLILGILIQSAIIGQLVILLYALAAFIFRISSRMTFFMVLGCFMVVLFASARSDVTLAATFAMYAFFLLIIGTISLAREVRSEI